MRTHIVSLLLLAAAFPQSSGKAVPVEQEPLHKVVLQNDDVTVMHLTLPAGQRTRYHTHTHDRVAIVLSDTSITNQNFGDKQESAAHPAKAGEFTALALNGASETHRVHNVGKNPYDVLDIEPAARPASPSTEVAATVAAENPSARVYNWVLAPGDSSPMHTHMRPYIIVAVTSMNLKMSSPDGQTATHQVDVADFKYVDARITHNLSNAGATTGQIIEVELK